MRNVADQPLRQTAMKSDPSLPIDAEARGKLRTWKRRAAAQWAVFDRGFAGEAFVEASFDWAFKTGRGQARAVARMQSLLGEGAVREVPPAGGRSQVILWSILRPREAVTKPLDLASERVAPGLLQPCTAV